MKNDLVEFFYEVRLIYTIKVKIDIIKNFNTSLKGFGSDKRYLNINITDNQENYWKFVYDNKISNILLLEDKFDESFVRKKRRLTK